MPMRLNRFAFAPFLAFVAMTMIAVRAHAACAEAMPIRHAFDSYWTNLPEANLVAARRASARAAREREQNERGHHRSLHPAHPEKTCKMRAADRAEAVTEPFSPHEWTDLADVDLRRSAPRTDCCSSNECNRNACRTPLELPPPS